jgi:uncharacterized repeat protein (TIGR01451 family)
MVCAQDTEPPNVLSFDFDPKSIDTSTSSREVTVTARLTDDLSGVDLSTQARFRSPSGNQFADVGFWPPGGLISGDELDGIYESKLTLPQHSEQGIWKLDYIYLRDNVGNRRQLSKDDAAASGFPTEFVVVSVGDAEPPNILSFDFDPKSIDTSTSSREVTVTARLTDDLSGVDLSTQARFRSPSGNQFADVGFWPPGGLISGDELDGIYESKLTLPQHSEQGIWKLDYIYLRDNVGNRRQLSKDDAAASGFPTEFVVVSVGDAEPPNILSFDFDPKSIDTSTSSREVTVTARLTDDLSGVDLSTQARFRSPSGNQFADVGFWPPGGLISGDELDGIYESKLTLPQHSEQGTWKLDYIYLRDNVGNRRQLSQEDVAVLGFPTTFRNGHSGAFSISGMKFNDLDNNGAKDAGEFGLPGWTIELLLGGEVIDSTETGDDGTYAFDYLAPGSYTVREVQQAGWVQTRPPGGSHSVDLVNADSTGNDFGNHQIKSMDVETPNVLSFDFDPKSVDTSTSSQDITFTVRLKDDLSGIGMSDDLVSYWSGASFQSPSGEQRVSVSFHQNDRVSGTDLDGIYESKMTLPRYSEKGTWKLDYVSISDRVGNTKRLDKDDMTALSFPTEFEVESIGDVTPPNILEFGFDPKSVDTSTSSQDITFTVRLKDDLSGIGMSDDLVSYWSGASFQSPSGEQRVSVSFHQNDRVSGTDLDGIYESKMTLPRYSEKGTWKLDYVSISDRVGNTKRLDKDDMTSLGFPTEFQNDPSYNPPAGLSIEKTASSSSISPGDLLNYTIIYSNTGDVRLTEVVITERYPAGVEFISASPAPDPGTNNRWTIGDLPVDDTGKIIVTVGVSELQDFEFADGGRIVGEGFVNVRESLSTSRGPIDLKNVATITSAETAPASAAASVTVGDPGTELEAREHGSGSYENEERVHVRTENKSISMDKDMAATYSPTTLALYNNRTVVYTSSWTEEANAKNRVTGTSMSEQYRYATFIDRESSFFLDENESVMNIDSEFDGMGHIGFLKMPSNTSTAYDTPTIEVREDYVGSFKILQRVDEYGSSVSYEKAASGSGFAVGDRRVKDSQRSYESGTGEYDSEEIIETSTNYIAKDISLVSGPMNQSLTEDVSISASQKWKEGMYSTTPKVSYIGEEFTNLDYLDKETIAKGLNEMNTQASFEGRARFRALLEPNKGNPEVDMDEQYEGDYSIERKVHFTGIAKYDRPHLNLTKTLDGIVEETLPWEYGEPHLEGAVKKRKVATYTITIENDGNAAFDKVYVKDTFPPGASFIEPSSLRPKVITDTYANWTLQNLPIGSALNITLKLDVTKYAPVELVNRVDACGVYDDETVCARNFSALEINWLTCCIVPREEQLSVVKTAEVDETNSSVVRYKIEITNWEDATRVATVTDRLPAGMKLIESSIPFATYEDGVVVWNLIEIPASGTAAIEFSVLAPGDGRYTNIVEVDPRSVDRPVVQPVRATCVINVGIVEDECGAVSCDSWQPPNWEFEHVGYGQDQTTCEDLTCAICDGTDFCLAP